MLASGPPCSSAWRRWWRRRVRRGRSLVGHRRHVARRAKTRRAREPRVVGVDVTAPVERRRQRAHAQREPGARSEETPSAWAASTSACITLVVAPDRRQASARLRHAHVQLGAGVAASVTPSRRRRALCASRSASAAPLVADRPSSSDDRDTRRAAGRQSVALERHFAAGPAPPRAAPRAAVAGLRPWQHAAVGLPASRPAAGPAGRRERGPRSRPPSSRASSACDGNRATGTPAGSNTQACDPGVARGPGRSNSAPPRPCRIDRQQRAACQASSGSRRPRPAAPVRRSDPPLSLRPDTVQAPKVSATARSMRTPEPVSSSGLRRSRWRSAAGATRRNSASPTTAWPSNAASARAAHQREFAAQPVRTERDAQPRRGARTASGTSTVSTRARASTMRRRSLRPPSASAWTKASGRARRRSRRRITSTRVARSSGVRTSTDRPKRSSSCGRSSPSSGISTADEDEARRVAHRQALALDHVLARGGHVDQQVHEVVLEQVHLVDVEEATIRAREQSGLERLHALRQRALEVERADDAVFGGPEREVDHRDRHVVRLRLRAGPEAGAVGTGIGGRARIARVTAADHGPHRRQQCRSAHRGGLAGAAVTEHEDAAHARVDGGDQDRLLHLVLADDRRKRKTHSHARSAARPGARRRSGSIMGVQQLGPADAPVVRSRRWQIRDRHAIKARVLPEGLQCCRAGSTSNWARSGRAAVVAGSHSST